MKPLNRSKLTVLYRTLPLLALALASLSANAATFTWTQTAGGTQQWETDANWLGGSAPTPASGDTVDFSTVNIANTTLNLNADRTATTWKFGDTSGGQTWTVNAGSPGSKLILAGTNPSISVQSGITTTVNAVVDGTVGLIKENTGTLTLRGADAHTITGGITAKNGTLAINLSDLTTPTDLLANTNSLTLHRATFSVTGKNAVSAQTLGNPSFTSGASVISLSANSGVNTLNLTLGDTWTRSAGSAVNIQLNTGATLTSSPSLTSDIVGPWASIGTGTSTRYATVSGGNIAPLTGTAAANAAALTDTTGTVNYDLAAATGTTPAEVSANTIRYTGGAAATAAGTTSFSVNGLMNAGTGTWTIGTNPITIGDDQELVVNTANNNITISSAIGNNAGGASSLTKTGGSTLTLSTANSYSGGTTLNAGTLTIQNAAALGGGTFTLNGGTVSVSSLTLSGAIPIVMNGDWRATTSNSGATFNTGTGDITLNAPITINVTNSQLNLGGAIISTGSVYNALDISVTRSDTQNAGVTFTSGILLRSDQVANQVASGTSGGSFPSITYSSPITDGGNNYGLTFSSPTTYSLGGANTFTGAMVINSGSTVALRPGGSIEPSSITIDAGATLRLGEHNLGSSAATIDLATTITNNGVLRIGDNTAYVQGTHFPSGIPGTGSILVSGTRANYVTLNGTNTYLGGTSVIYTGGGGPVVLNINSANAIGTGPLTLSQSGSNSATIDNTSGAPITLAANNTQNWNGPIIFTGTNALNLGTGTVTLANNPTMNVSANTLTVGGTISGSGNTLSKAGAGILELNGATTLGSLNVGQNNSGGTLTIGTGATISVGSSASNNLYVGSNTGGSNPVGNGTFNARGFSAIVGNIGVGFSSAPTSASGTSTGVFTLYGDGTIQADNFYVGVGLSSGAGGNFRTNGSFSLATDATLDLSGTTGAGASLYIGWSFGGGNASQQIGSMDLSAGAADLTLSQLSISRGSNSVSGTGTLTLSGSHSNHLVVSGSGNVVTIGATSGTSSTGTATLRNLDATSAITSTNNSTAIVLGANSNGTGNLTLSDSTLTITTTGSAIARVAGTGHLTLDNTTLIAGASNAVSGKWITNLNTATLTNTVTFDSGVYAISTDQVFTGAGGLTKAGAGTLTLDGANIYAGATLVSGGTLALGASASLNTSGVELEAGTAFDTTAQSYVIPTAKPVTIHLDSAGAGSSGKITAASLDITNATVVVVIDNETDLDDPVYVLAEYASLTGTEFASITAPPTGYAIDYNYNNEDKIAWVLETGGNDYDDWAATFLPDADVSDPAADFDGDGMSNFQEYAFGLNPTSGASVNPITNISQLTDGIFSYTRRENSGLTYSIWYSGDLEQWHHAEDADQSETVSGDPEIGVETVTVELPNPLEPAVGTTKLFIRVKAD